MHDLRFRANLPVTICDERKKSMLFHRSAENFLFILYEIVEEWDWPLFLSLINGSNRIVFSQPGYRIVIENGALP